MLRRVLGESAIWKYFTHDAFLLAAPLA